MIQNGKNRPFFSIKLNYVNTILLMNNRSHKDNALLPWVLIAGWEWGHLNNEGKQSLIEKGVNSHQCANLQLNWVVDQVTLKEWLNKSKLVSDILYGLRTREIKLRLMVEVFQKFDGHIPLKLRFRFPKPILH